MKRISIAFLACILAGTIDVMNAQSQPQPIPVGPTVSSMSFDKGYIWAFDADSGWLTRVQPGDQTGGESRPFPGATAFAADENTAFIGYANGSVTQLDWNSPGVVRTLRSAGDLESILSLKLYGPYFVGLSPRHTLKLYDLVTGNTYEGNDVPAGCINCVQVAGSIAVFLRSTGQLINEYSVINRLVWHGHEVRFYGDMHSLRVLDNQWVDLVFLKEGQSNVVRFPLLNQPGQDPPTVTINSPNRISVVGNNVYGVNPDGQPFAGYLSDGTVTFYQTVPGATEAIFDGYQHWANGSNATVPFTPIGARFSKTIPIINPKAMVFDGKYVWVHDPATRTLRPF